MKWDGFRALISPVDGLRVKSRRGWDMTPLLPEPRSLPAGLVLDGELVAFRDGVPHFPHLTRRLLHGDRSIAVTFVAFDVLQADGHDRIRELAKKWGLVLPQPRTGGPTEA
jgi:bifunctional non-homologous end joining protein LigD